jgi:hypothetical protein
MQPPPPMLLRQAANSTTKAKVAFFCGMKSELDDLLNNFN